MPNWPTLDPVEQHDKLTDITSEVLPTLPTGWTRLVVRARMIGTHAESDSGVRMPDGTVRAWSFPPEVWRKFQQLRKGMYIQDSGSWHEFEYILDPPSHFTIQYNRDLMPAFSTPPTAEHFATENRWFPRSDQAMPDWFRRGLGQV
ncbi:hypothetical protein [Nocardia ninae]|uniref:Uncharacterized protein n=1 Tax=Nocardia ninae NBRC 108245 TaxID=1210091 RepID=A0A511ME20_9NOCA|nr:hypothetical protein [Nocardia ninae]GEM38895.1 hypothetical protein NN4_34140 [Nocardia ninae NBRC 108245]